MHNTLNRFFQNTLSGRSLTTGSDGSFESQLTMNRVGLRFLHQVAETDYRQWRIDAIIPFTRVGWVASAIAWLIALGTCWVSMPDLFYRAAPTVCFLILPINLAGLIFAYVPRLYLGILPMLVFANCIFGIAGVWLLHKVIGAPGAASAVSIITAYFAFTIFRLPPISATLATLPYTLLILYWLTLDYYELRLGVTEYWAYMVTPIIALITGLLVCAIIEQMTRQAYASERIIEYQKQALTEWNHTLEQRVDEGVRQIEQMGRLKRFLSPQIAELIVGGTLGVDIDDPLKSHRREITVIFLDLRGFTAFTEAADPEEVMGVLHEYHSEMGRLIMQHNGTIEHFAGDGIMIFFNDPVMIENPAQQAVNMAIRMQTDFAGLAQVWKKRGYDLDLGIGIAQGYATLGTIGFEGRRDYGAIGPVCNLASRLCGEAKGGQILVSEKVFGFVEKLVAVEPVGERNVKGFHKPVPAFNVTGHLDVVRK